ncbi:hypothetical protein K503DRAFT_260891 [Rhizopogon vinicolor AM-OR11-026]|uniref:Uncharacterized protein n=1 Tax=Rhizopogon vinicolor AM-OR11-026 TaxID=1314800 RepID=A0A1B7MWM0_9AGAM|nr:hypothetical protein K503DRAFT_260891 [Rhizopogon vinicolor AM-OR11-026]
MEMALDTQKRIPTNSDAIPPSNGESRLPTLSSMLPIEAEVVSKLQHWSGNNIGPNSASSELDIPPQLAQVSCTNYRVTSEEIEDEEDLIAIRGIRWREPPQPLSAPIIEQVNEFCIWMLRQTWTMNMTT